MFSKWMSLIGLILVINYSSADQTQIPDYDTARDTYIYKKLYLSGGKTFYCKANFSSKKGFHVEHIFPASWMKEAAGCAELSRKECRRISDRFNLMEADLHNLHPAIDEVNRDRSNYFFAIIGTDDSSHSYQHPRLPEGCDFEVDVDNRLIEPPVHVRGEVARAVFYIMHEYGASIDKQMLTLLLKWNLDDPPSEHEKWRNNEIEQLQGNRNPFIDNHTNVPSVLARFISLSENTDTGRKCLIKGNISRLGHIYHLPGSRVYEKVKITPNKGERWFCSTKEAEESGWRPARS